MRMRVGNVREWWLVTVMVAVALVPVAAAHAQAPLRVGVSADYRPMVYYDKGKLTGIDVALAHEAGEILQRRVEFVELPQQQLLAALKAGKIDVIMSPLRVSGQNDAAVVATDAYMKVGQMAIIRARDAGRLASPRAIFRIPVTVGVQTGSAGAAYARKHWPKNRLREFATPEQGLKALHDGDIDVFIHDSPTSWAIANSAQWGDLMSLYRPLTHETLNWLVRAGDNDLRRDLDDVIASLRESGRLSAIRSFWIPVRVEVD